jgi:hypothetical protein
VAPTAELAQHHDLTPPQRSSTVNRSAWEIRTRVQALHFTEAIDDAEFEACKRWRRDWDLGMEGVVMAAMKERVDGGVGGSALDAQVEALSRLRLVKDELGAFASVLLVMCLAHDVSWVAIGRRIGVSNHAARSYAIDTIKCLTAFYQLFDRGMKKTA